MNLSRVTRTRYRTKRDEPGGVRKLSKCKKIYPRLAANGARVATRGAREGQKLHILPFITGITCRTLYIQRATTDYVDGFDRARAGSSTTKRSANERAVTERCRPTAP